MTLVQYFRLIDTQARMALRADASRYFFGYIWWVLEPLLWVSVFYLVFDVILSRGKVDFLVFLMCGKLSFIWFSKTVNQASNSIVQSRGLISKINVTKTLFPMAVVQESLYKQSTVFLVLFAVLLGHGYEIGLGQLWFFPLVFVNYLMIVVCSLIGAYAVCLLRDFSMLIPLVMTFLLFASGIFWDVRDLEPAKMELVLMFNPVAFMLDGYRQVLMYQTPPDLVHLSVLGGVLCVLLAGMVWLMRRNSQFLALKALTA